MSATNGPTLPDGPAEMLNTERLSDYIGLSVATLERMRGLPGGIPFFKLGNGRTSRVMYDRRDVDAWLASKRRNSTGDGGDDA
jgi:hypothetical protein